MPRRPQRPHMPRAMKRSPHQGRPPGLRGKEIGLYYRNLSRNPKKQVKDKWIHLRIPKTVIDEIYKCLEKVENIARTSNIYLPLAKKLEFVVPVLPTNMDFIPINAPDTERLNYKVTNIHQRNDNDVIYVGTKDPEVIEILDLSFEDTANDNFKETNTPSTSASSSMYESKEKKSDLEIQHSNTNLGTSETCNNIESKTSNETGVFVSTSYTNNPPNTSANKSTPQNTNGYKYAYEDIITGTFEEKLDESISQGIKILTTDHETNELSNSLKIHHEYMTICNEKYKEMLKFRQTLPTYRKAGELLDVINSNQVVVISGETGCGKSTQVPQLILDQAFENGKGGNVKILVTEPRRIAASSLAVRVAEERGEQVGDSIGYAVRLESKPSRERGSIMFCTTGVLLVELETDQALSGYSHIILDEVHERDCQIDLTMCMLKRVLKKRKDLKLILMSATIDAESLSQYFDNCPMFHIEGIAYPVKDVYLEEILALTNFKLPPQPNFLKEPKVWHKYSRVHRNATNELEKSIQYKGAINSWLQPLKRTYSSNVIAQLQDHRIEDLNLRLIRELLIHICRGPPGAVLVILPGISDITFLMTLMRESDRFPQERYEIYTLHSKLPSIQQKQIFDRPPDHMRKIIIATNIVETSITIDDVVYVVDCGKMKYKGLDVEKNHATLLTEWVSKANLRQRRGRAGRCQPGICYHLLTTFRAENIPDRVIPELQRSNLLEEVLCIKKLRLGKAEDALKMMPAVPAEKTIHTAIKHLQQLGALDENETLTPLGWHLARLPVHPAAGKLLILGSLFGCVNRAASVAAVWGFKDPFVLTLDNGSELDRVKRRFALGEPSDHIAMAEAIIQWENASDGHSFARRHFLSNNTLLMLSDMKKQFANNLKQMGFLKSGDIESSWANRNQENLSLFKALVAASLYPNIATVRWINGNAHNSNKPTRIIAYTPEDGNVSMHPSSVMYTKHGGSKQEPICKNTGANWLVYGLKQKSTQLFLLDVTCVFTLPLLFFGELKFTRADNPDECLISISSLKVCCKRETAQLLFQLRSLLDEVMTSRISHLIGDETQKRFEFDQEVLNAVTDLITAEDVGTEYLEDYDRYDSYELLPPELGIDDNFD